MEREQLILFLNRLLANFLCRICKMSSLQMVYERRSISFNYKRCMNI